MRAGITSVNSDATAVPWRTITSFDSQETAWGVVRTSRIFRISSATVNGFWM
jgi:hypothetical protein